MNIDIDGIIFSLQKSGGISNYFSNLIKTLISKRANINLISYPPNSFVDIPPHPNLNLDIRESRLLERYRRCINLKCSSNIFHTSYYRLPSKRAGVNVITVYDFLYERYSRGIKSNLHSFQKFKAIKNSDIIICISSATFNDLNRFIDIRDDQKVFIVPCGVSSDFYVQDRIKKSPKYILYVGARSGYKNFSVVVEALKLLPDLHLYCIGGGKLDELNNFSAPRSVLDRILHIPYATDSELNTLYNNAICLVYPSLYEGFGIPPIEAMKCGCPVVAIKSCISVAEIGGNALYLASNSDPVEISCLITESMGSSRIPRINLGIEIAGKLSWENIHEKTFEIYASAL